MSFLSTLAKIAGPIAGVAAAPFTGGASLLGTLGSIGGALGPVLGGAAKGSADQRLAEQPGLIGTQNANLQGARDSFSAGMAGAQFGANERDAAMKRAMLASLLGGVQDASISRPEGSTIPTFGVSGGLRPSAMTNKDALIAQLGSPAMSAPTYQGPSPLEMPKAGLGEKVMGGIGLGGSILGALGGLFGPKAPQLGGPYATPPLVQNQNISQRYT